jgi:hypothetical protein
MDNRRRFLIRGLGSLVGLGGGGLLLHSLAQDNADNQARGMITPATQEAIDAGLLHLARTQNEDGSWDDVHCRVAITSLCGLAFMAGGHQPGRGRHGQVVTRALQYVLSREDRNTPGFLTQGRQGFHGPMYGHGFATLFLAEAYGMVSNKELRGRVKDTLKNAVHVIIRSQNIEGGWRYKPGDRDADISVTICQIMALRAARNAGVAVPKSTVDRCVEYVKRCQDRRGGWFRYQAQGGGGYHQAFARTAAGVCALYSAGIYKGPEIDNGLKYLMGHKPGMLSMRRDMHYFYGHYYAVQAMWTAGGKYWEEWFPAIRDELVSNQRSEGFWIDHICSHYGTAMACIILQVPNNYLPILQK